MGSFDPIRENPRGGLTPARHVLRALGGLCLAVVLGASPLRAAPESPTPSPANAPASQGRPRPGEPRQERVATRERTRELKLKLVRRDPSDDGKTAPALMPQQWLPSRGSECIRRGPNRGFCAGPRRVPKPRGEAAELARRLGLGDRKSCAFLLFQPPKAAWVAAAQRDRDADALLWPIEQGRLLRGIGNLHAARKRREAMFLSNRSAKPSPIKPPGAGAGRHPHEGLDIGAKLGTPIRAARGGLVVYSDNGLTGYGNLVILVHPDSSVTLYAHCRATYVFPGQRVERGQIIGEVGETGFARGPHLHFEYRIDGRAADQMPLLELDEPSALAAEGGGHLTTPRTPP